MPTPITKYVDYALVLSTTSQGFESGSLQVGNDAKRDEIMTGSSLKPDLIQVVGKMPFIRATLLDPSLVTSWQAFGSGKSITAVEAYFAAYDSTGGIDTTTQKSYKMSNGGVIMPVSLSASMDSKATLDILAYAIFATGTGIAVGTSTASAASITKAFYPTSITLAGGAAITSVKSMSVNWQYNTSANDQLEPTYYYYDRAQITGSCTVKDVTTATNARVEDGGTETVTLLLTDANNGANTVSIALSNCKVFVTVKGDLATINFEQVA